MKAEAKKGKLKFWLMEPRPPFLLLTVCLVFLGTSIAWHNGFFNLLYFALALGGTLLAHMSVDVLNDYFDYKSGLDLDTERTPFSGGSGLLPGGQLNPRSVYILGLVFLGFVFMHDIFVDVLKSCYRNTILVVNRKYH